MRTISILTAPRGKFCAVTSSAAYHSDLLLTAGDAFMRAGKHRKAHRAYNDSWNDEGRHLHDPTRQVWHLLALSHAHNDDSAIDNLARALICGGPDMFVDEDPGFLADLEQILLPPPELGTWDDYPGVNRDLLNGATGYLAELLAHRLGTPPPYAT